MTEHRQTQNPELTERFRGLVSRCAPEADAGSLCATVQDRYSEPHRRYHTLEHIEYCLSQLDRARHLAADPDAIELALWFHDIIYDPTADDNERRSAELFKSLLGGYLPDERAARVYRLIMLTEHPSEPDDGDEQLMVDIDLSSFGRPWEDFMRDTTAIRAELTHVPQERFVKGKLEFLDAMLSRSRFYLSDYFHDRLEGRARANIERYTRDIKSAL